MVRSGRPVRNLLSLQYDSGYVLDGGFDAWKKAESEPAYARMKAEWKEKYG